MTPSDPVPSWLLASKDDRDRAGQDPLRPTRHLVVRGDARDLSWLADESVHLVVTSPPYGLLKEYEDVPGQLGNGADRASVASYDDFLEELDKVWRECARVLVPGGRVCAVVGDVCLSRRAAGRHLVLPLPSDIQVRARAVGLDNLTPIRWLKIANVALEASRSSVFLGKPNLPGGVIKNDIETIVMLRKPGGYRKPTPEMEAASRIPTDDYVTMFRPIWSDIPGESPTRWRHPAPFPETLATRLIRMFSFAGDTVLDPFAGSGTTAVCAAGLHRNSISVEVVPTYVRTIGERLARESSSLDHCDDEVWVLDHPPAAGHRTPTAEASGDLLCAAL